MIATGHTGAENAQRIAHLDGIRGLAIALVLGFHTFYRWRNEIPGGDLLSSIPLFKYGSLGVELFFMVSGFVIFMTLDRSKNFADFAYRRWLRLFPAMLIVSLIVFITSPLFPERPAGPGTLMSLIPGLTFIDPRWFARVGLTVEPIEGAFWSLFVEVKFYLIAGLAYFVVGRTFALLSLFTLYLMAWSTTFAADLHMVRHGLQAASYSLAWGMSAIYFNWMIGGALTYLFAQHRDMRLLWLAVAVVGIPALCDFQADLGLALAELLVAAIFLAPFFSSWARGMLSWRVFAFLGFVSYPLYLCHENLVVALMIKISRAMPGLPFMFVPLLPLAVVIGLAWFVARHAEPWARARIRTLAPDVRVRQARLRA